MTDFVLPTQAAVDALTPASFTLTDSDVGYLTKEVGSVVKLLVDQMSSSELVHIRSVRTATGKTTGQSAARSLRACDRAPTRASLDYER